MKTRGIVGICVGAAVVVLAFLIVRPDIFVKAYLKSHSGEYNAVYVSQFPTDNIDFESYKTFNLENVYCIETGKSYLRVNECLVACLIKNPHVTKVYVGLNYKTFRPDSLMLAIIDRKEGVAWDIVVPPEYIGNLKNCNHERKTEAIKNVVQKYADRGNVRLMGMIMYPGVDINPMNFDENGLKEYLTVYFIVDSYEISPSNVDERISTFLEFTVAVKESDYPDLSDETWVFFGDSIIANANPTDSIPALMEYFTGVKYVDYSVGGARACITGEEEFDSNTFTTQLDRFEAESPELGENVTVFINFGLNDFFGGCNVNGERNDSYEGAMQRGISRIQELIPNCRIIVSGPEFVNYKEGEALVFENGEVLQVYRDEAEKIAKMRGCFYIDNFSELEINAENASFYLEDSVHFNVNGRYYFVNNVLNDVRGWNGQ